MADAFPTIVLMIFLSSFPWMASSQTWPRWWLMAATLFFNFHTQFLCRKNDWGVLVFAAQRIFNISIF